MGQQKYCRGIVKEWNRLYAKPENGSHHFRFWGIVQLRGTNWWNAHETQQKLQSVYLLQHGLAPGGHCRKMMNHQYLLCGDQLYVKFTGIRIKKTYIMKLNKIKHFYKKSENLSFLPIDYKLPASWKRLIPLAFFKHLYSLNVVLPCMVFWLSVSLVSQEKRTSYVCTTCHGWGTEYYTTTLRWRRSRAGSQWATWRAACIIKWVSII